MIVAQYIQDDIKAMCLDAGVKHYKVLPYVLNYYRQVNASRVFPREIINTARDRINEMKGEQSISVADVINQREKYIHDSKLLRGE